jgi:Flp pilus assembly protein TadG
MIKGSRGQALVEFALVFPVLFFILAITIDLFRVDWATTTVAEAARQGARQAVANADPTDNPFGGAAGACSGTTQTPNANGSGCLTDSRIFQTVTSVLGGFSQGTTFASASPSACPNPAVGRASVCVYPSEAGGGGSYSSCAAARSSLGRDPMAGDLGSRGAEYQSPKYKGCFQIVVTVIYRYDTLVPFLGGAAPGFLRIASSTTMLGEY